MDGSGVEQKTEGGDQLTEEDRMEERGERRERKEEREYTGRDWKLHNLSATQIVRNQLPSIRGIKQKKENNSIYHNFAIFILSPTIHSILLFYYFIILLFYYSIILLFYYFITLLFYYFIILLFYYFIILLFYYLIILLFYYFII